MKDQVIKEALRAYGTPVYLFDTDEFEMRIRRIRQILGEEIRLCYAMKANPFLIKSAVRVLDRLEVCSPGEFAICEQAGIPMEDIVLSGVYKSEKDVEYVLEKYRGRGTYTIESEAQFRLLAGKAQEKGLTLSVLLRLTNGGQFGMDEEVLCGIIADRAEYPHMKIEGVQFFTGTQKKNRQLIEDEIHRMDVFLKRLKADYGFEAEHFEYGPGLFVSYFQNEKQVDMEEELNWFRDLLHSMEHKGRITLEMGRYMAASCGYYMTKIVDEKHNHGTHYALVDGGINHLNYYGQTMAMKLPYFRQLDADTLEEKRGEADDTVTLCGALCTVNDILVRKMPLKGDILGDILVFENIGAYSVTEGIYLFLSRDLPKITVWSEEGGLRLVRDTFESWRLNGENTLEVPAGE